jgi:tRNA (adenine22-N1)-methyltransferase
MSSCIKLTARLSQIASFVKRGSIVADIGTDHGYIPVYLRQTDTCQFVIASDINQGPLDSAVKTAEKYGISDIRFVHAPGLDGISPTDADTIVIAGMGGETITDILNAAPWVHSRNISLILQPQSKTEVLSEFLRSGGFHIADIRLVRDCGRIYLVLLSEVGEFGEPDRFFLRHLAAHYDPLLHEYAGGILQKLQRRHLGLIASSCTDEKELDAVNSAEAELEHIIEECEKWHQ